MKINNVTPNVANAAQNAPKKVPFTGLIGEFKPSKLKELSRQGTMGTGLFIANAFVFLLGSRILTSRDKDEKREVLIRDIPTIVLAVAGVPMLEKAIAKVAQNKSGVAITQHKGGELVDYSQLKDWYTYDNKLSNGRGLKGFSERLGKLCDELGEKVSLKKMYSNLGDNVKEKISKLSDNNKEFINQITKDKNLEKMLKTELSKEGNALFKKAETLKTITKSIGLGSTLALIGVFIPKINIMITESIHKKKAAAPEKKQTPETK